MKLLTSALIFCLGTVQVFAKTADKRPCADTGISVSCGEASHLVQCDGYANNYYLDNQEVGFDLKFEHITKGYKFPGPYESKKNIFTIPSTRGPLSEYRYVVEAHGKSMLDGTFKMPDFKDPADLRGKSAFEDIKKAVDKWKKTSNFKLNPDEVNDISLDTYKIAATSNLYQKCEKKHGTAPLSSGKTVEQKSGPSAGNR